jgi:hypothetical protein
MNNPSRHFGKRATSLLKILDLGCGDGRLPVAESEGGTSRFWPSPSISVGDRRHETAVAPIGNLALSKDARCGMVSGGLQHPVLAIV